LSGDRGRRFPSATPALLSYGFRPFFLAAGLWAAGAIALWIAVLETGMRLPSRFDPLTWHIHEMLFGFVLAAIAGFLLTAIPNWTGRAPVAGAPLAVLLGLWTAGRVAVLLSAWMPAWLAIALDLAFPAALAALIAREILVAGNRRNIPIIAPVLVLGLAAALMDSSLEGYGSAASYGWRLGLTAILILISVIGGRIVPSFTRNWLTARQRTRLPQPSGIVERLSLGLLHAALVVWVFAPAVRASGIGLLCAAGINFWRLLRWRGIDTRGEPLLLVLHVGYAWLVLGVGALGVSILSPGLPMSAAIHALTAGAIGTMILAVMTRATRGHTGRDLAADRATTLVFALVVLAAVVRIGAALAVQARTDLLLASAALWVGAFALFALCYGPLLLRPKRAG